MSDQNTQIMQASDSCMLNVYPHALKLTFSHAKGSRIYDISGKEYLDFSTGLGVNGLGFADPRIEDIVTRVVKTGVCCTNLFYHKPQLELAQLLVKLTGLQKVFFSNSGAEANEAGIKCLRRYGSAQDPKRYRIICFVQGWHGRTMATISACRDASMQSGFEPLLPGFDPVNLFDLSAIEASINSETVAVLIEPVLGHGGIKPAPTGFLKALRKLCDKHGIMLMLDEIQSGLGRCGSVFYYEKEGIKPDVLTLAKCLGNGYPIGATIVSEEIAKHMTVGSHGSATGGNILSTSVAKYVLETVSNPDFLEEINRKSDLLKSLLIAKLSNLDLVSEIRVVGLLVGIDVKCNAKLLTNHLAKQGIITTALGTTCVRLMPALNIADDDLNTGVEILSKAIASYKE